MQKKNAWSLLIANFGCRFQIKCIEAYKKFYESSTKNRKLSWIYSLGTCNINAKFDAKSIELNVATYQVSIGFFSF